MTTHLDRIRSKPRKIRAALVMLMISSRRDDHAGHSWELHAQMVLETWEETWPEVVSGDGKKPRSEEEAAYWLLDGMTLDEEFMPLMKKVVACSRANSN